MVRQKKDILCICGHKEKAWHRQAITGFRCILCSCIDYRANNLDFIMQIYEKRHS